MTRPARSSGLRGSHVAVASGAGTVGDLMRIYEERAKANAELKPASISARLVALKKVKKTWPGLEALKPSQVTHMAITDWANRFKADGTNFTAPGAKRAIRGNSATSVNRAVDTLRRVLDVAVERGAIHSNPVVVRSNTEGRLKKKITRKKLTLPGMADVHRMFDAMEHNGVRGGWGKEAADFCRALSYSGCRIAEAGALSWQSIDWKKKLVQVKGEKSETSDRVLPLFPELEVLLKNIRERRKAAAKFSEDGKPFLAPTDPIFRLSECQKTIDKACETTGVARITHHDFRHLFATMCIESQVDIPTVSRWLGHRMPMKLRVEIAARIVNEERTDKVSGQSDFFAHRRVSTPLAHGRETLHFGQCDFDRLHERFAHPHIAANHCQHAHVFWRGQLNIEERDAVSMVSRRQRLARGRMPILTPVCARSGREDRRGSVASRARVRRFPLDARQGEPAFFLLR